MTTHTTTHPSTSPTASWRTIDLMATAVIGVVFGVAYWGWSSGYTAIDAAAPALGAAKGLLGGPWLIAGVVAGLVVRRPGAAVTAETLAAAVSGILGTQWGAAVLLSGLLQGLGVELALAFFLFRSYRVWVAALGGVLAASFEMLYEWDGFWMTMSTSWKLTYFGCFALSGAVVAGVGGWLLTRALAASGAIDALPAGREAAEGRAG
ncbi:MAG: ECF transporter S component [Nocardioidaceae bacterium]|jgi:energy-coupling factor transport system substrate-specific component